MQSGSATQGAKPPRISDPHEDSILLGIHLPEAVSLHMITTLILHANVEGCIQTKEASSRHQIYVDTNDPIGIINYRSGYDFK